MYSGGYADRPQAVTESLIRHQYSTEPLILEAADWSSCPPPKSEVRHRKLIAMHPLPPPHGADDPTTGALRIVTVPTPPGGLLGLCHCPGRCGPDRLGREWRRDLAEDLGAIEAWGAKIVVTLIESQEFVTLGVPSFAQSVRGYAFDWHHVPVPDMRPPQAQALQAWQKSGPEVLAALRRSEHVLVHCAAGLGRTGTMAAKLLVAFGVPPVEAISQVRAARPGALETAEQEAFVLDADAWSAPLRR